MSLVSESPKKLLGRRIMVTGVSHLGQVGAGVAAILAGAGAELVMLDRDSAQLNQRASEIGNLTPVRAYACDLTSEAAVTEMASDLGQHVDGIDALVNVAGGFAISGPVAVATLETFDRQMAINLRTAFLATRAMLPLLRTRRGAVIFFASAAALPGANVAEMSAYVAAKSGVIALMRAIAEEERPHGVRANAIAPTAIRTDTNASTMDPNTAFVEISAVASVVSFLCSEESRPLTGQVLRMG